MPIIDAAVFNDLKQMSGGDFITELIDAFLDEGPDMISNLQAALEAGDVDSFRRNAHSLKTNANTFGALRLGFLARELETMARENDLNVGNRLDQLKEAFSEAAQELRGMRT